MRWRTHRHLLRRPFQGIEPTGARVELEGIDLLTIEDGLIRRNDAYYDGTSVRAPDRADAAARLRAPSAAMTQAFNVRTRMTRSLFKPNVEQVADGVWLVQGGFPLKTMNVYLIEDGDGVTVFDAGIESMTNGIAGCGAAASGGITRVVLGHGHADHRGAAPGLGVPVWCHPDEVADAEGDGGAHYFDFSKLERWYRARFDAALPARCGTAGPVKIEGTVKRGRRGRRLRGGAPSRATRPG